MSSQVNELSLSKEVQPTNDQTLYELNSSNGLSQSVKPIVSIENEDLLAVGATHRKIANPLPLGAWSFATTIMLFSLYNLKVQNIQVQSALLTMSIFLGGLVQYVAGLWEFASGNTFGGEWIVTVKQT